MSPEIVVKISETDGMIERERVRLMGMGIKIADLIAEKLWVEVKNNIARLGLYKSGNLYESVEKTDLGWGFIVSVGGELAPYAIYLERGTGIYGPFGQTSKGRYVEDIDRRLINKTRTMKVWGSADEEFTMNIDIGVHYGNEAYHFFDDAVNTTNAVTDQQWLDAEASRILGEEP